MNRNLEALINNFLNCEISGNDIWNNINDSWRYDDVIPDIIYNQISRYRDRSNLNERRVNWPTLFESIVRYTLYLAPEIKNRPINSVMIYHYTRNEALIKANGLLASNFLSARNDDQETKYLVENLRITDARKAEIISTAERYRYNSFSFKRIDDFANDKYLGVDRIKRNNFFEIRKNDFLDICKRSGKSRWIFNGYIRYGLEGKRNMLEFLTSVIQALGWTFPSNRRDIAQLVSIATCFVKRRCGVQLDGSFHPYVEENEYRFLYVDLTPTAIIRGHYIPLSSERWGVTNVTPPKIWTCSID